MLLTPQIRKRPMKSIIRFCLANVNRVLFIGIHLVALMALIAAFFAPPTWYEVVLCVTFLVIRMFGITGGFHRYFSHHAYKTSRLFQFFLACLGCSALQKGPLWWASNHRKHHKHSDQEGDPHSPIKRSVWWSHVGWILHRDDEPTDYEAIKDFAKYWELRLLERFHWVPAFCLAGLCFLLAGWSGVIWGFFVSTVLLYHSTFLVNSVCHIFGSRRFNTPDWSRNNPVVAIITLGEGWHNNHHHYQSSARQGFRWWEVDVSFYILCFLRLLRLVWDLRPVPPNKLHPPSPASP